MTDGADHLTEPDREPVDPVTKIEQALRWYDVNGISDYRRWAKALVERIHTDLALRAALLGAPATGLSIDPDPLWEALDWCLWGVGMADTFREPLADKMVAALTPRERMTARDLIAVWRTARGGPGGLRVYEGLRAELADLKAEVERLRTEATWAQLAAETGAERAQAEYEHQGELLTELLRQADLRADGLRAGIREEIIEGQRAFEDAATHEATIARVVALCERWEAGLAPGFGRDLRVALCAPTEPAPDVEPLPTDPTTAEGRGLWIGDGMTINVPAGHDPPKRAPEDPHAATKERLTKAMRGMEPT